MITLDVLNDYCKTVIVTALHIVQCVLKSDLALSSYVFAGNNSTMLLSWDIKTDERTINENSSQIIIEPSKRMNMKTDLFKLSI